MAAITVFVPSVPTPFAGAVYILNRERVHPVDIPFTDAMKSISRWGAGSKNMVAAISKAGAFVKTRCRTDGMRVSGRV